MSRIDDVGVLGPENDASVTTGVRRRAFAKRDAPPNSGGATNNRLNRCEFERVQLLCRLGLSKRQFLPAILPYLRELIPASCSFVVWRDAASGVVSLCRESPRAIVLDAQSPRGLEAQHTLYGHFSRTTTRGRRCDLIPPRLMGLDKPQSAYRPPIGAILAVKLDAPRVLNGFLCLCRGVHAPAFSVAEQSALAKLAPEFTRALSREENVEPPFALSPESGFLVADDRGCVQAACARGNKLLSMILESRPRFIAKQSDLLQEPRQQIVEILDPNKPTETTWRYRNSWGDFLFHARLLREIPNPASRSVAVTVTREIPLALQVSQKCRQLSFTARHTEIVLALTRGESFPSIGRRLNISAHTVTDHVRKLYARLGVSSRDTLVARILL
jgi:DNA-binding CsgD family transcriptional regulator